MRMAIGVLSSSGVRSNQILEEGQAVRLEAGEILLIPKGLRVETLADGRKILVDEDGHSNLLLASADSTIQYLPTATDAVYEVAAAEEPAADTPAVEEPVDPTISVKPYFEEKPEELRRDSDPINPGYYYALGGGLLAAGAVFAFKGGGDSPDALSLMVIEDTPKTGTLPVSTDSATGTLTYALGQAPTQGTAVINADGTYTYTPNLNATGADSLSYTVTTATGAISTFQVSLTITGVNDAPVVDDQAFSLVENAANGTLIGTVAASDPDTGDTRSFAITGGNESGAFTINSTTGQITVANSAALDFETTPSFSLIISVTDTAGASGNATVLISLSNVPEGGDGNQAPVINSNGGGDAATITVSENSTAVTTVVATDADPGSVLTYSLGGTDAALFTIDPTTGVLSFIKAPDFETPADAGGDNVYDIVVTATDNGSPNLGDSQKLAVTVSDVIETGANQAPVITSDGGGDTAAIAIGEGSTAVTTVVATDADPGSVLIYSLGGVDAGVFSIDATTGALSFVTAPDFEAPGDVGGDNVYNVIVTASDNGSPGLSDSQSLAITVGDIVESGDGNHAPVITSDGGGDSAAISISENSKAVTTVVATDIDVGTVLTYSVSGTDADLFVIDPTTGVLNFIKAPDFETPGDAGGDNVYNVTVTATDNATPSLSDAQELAITVSNADEAPSGKDVDLRVNENSAVGTVVGPVPVTDPDGNSGSFTFAIVGGNTDGAFSINAVTGLISVANTAILNFEATPVFDLIIAITDAGGSGPASNISVTVSLNDVNEAPVITSNGGGATGTTTFAENSGAAVAIVKAADPDQSAPNNTITYSISGTDASLFTIDPVTGALRFITPPDLEAPADAGGDNVYNIDVTATDAGSPNLFDTQALAIKISNVNEAPVAVDDNFVTDEDTQLNESVITNDTDADGNLLTAVLVSGPTHGTLVLNADGSFTYTPNANYIGPDSFTYRANDGLANSNIATVNLTVAAVNDAPVNTVPGPQTVAEEAVLAFTGGSQISIADIDAGLAPMVTTLSVDHGTLSASGVGVTGNNTGTLTITGTISEVNAALASLTYTGSLNYNGTDTLTIVTNDGGATGSGGSKTDTDSVTINVTPVNDAPVAVGDSYTTNEDTTLNVPAPGVRANDTDIDGDPLTAVLVAGPTHGTLMLNANGSFTYTPAENYNGTDSFTYVANDGTVDSTPVTVDITIPAVNDRPVATIDSYTTDEDTPLTVLAPGVLENDTDIENDPLTSIVVTGPAHGTLNLATDGSFIYTPDADFNGEDSFTYKANDGTDDSVPVTVNITVAPVNDAPIAVEDSYTTDEDVPLVVVVPNGVLDNDSDIDVGDVLKAVKVSDPTNGLLTLNDDGSFTYTPNENFFGEDSFTYIANDGLLDSAPVTVKITVESVNDVPVAFDDQYTTDEEVELVIALPGVLGNDTDIESDPLTAALVDDVKNGTLALNPDGSFSYTPDKDFTGEDSFTYKANDGQDDSASATVFITVNNVNDAPVAVDDSYTTDEDVPLIVVVPNGVLDNDTDIDGDVLKAVKLTDPSNGLVTLNDDGSFTYTPNENFFGEDSFTYLASDGALDSAPVTVKITVEAVNDAPVAVDDAYSTDEDIGLSILLPGVLSNDTDVDGDALKAKLVTSTAHGALTLNEDGSFTYVPDDDFFGEDFFTYKADDGTSLSDKAAKVVITVNSVNDAPVALGESYKTNEDTPLVVTLPGLLDNDIDVDGDKLSAILDSKPSNGTLSLSKNGSFTYTPNENFFGEDSFTYHANDGTLDSNTVTVTIDVAAINDAPTTKNDQYNVNEGLTLTVIAPGVLLNDTDAENDPFTATKLTDPTHGTLTFNSDGSFIYTPNSGYVGADSFTYEATDGMATSGPTTVAITVIDVNEAPVITNGDNPLAVNDFPENSKATVASFSATDPDLTAPNKNFSFSVSGTDASLFNIDKSTGVLTFKNAPDFDIPLDSGKDNIYNFDVLVTDGGGLTDTQAVTVTVTDVNEAPVITSNGGGTKASFSVYENTTAVTKVVAIDPDVNSPNSTLTYSITGGADKSLFNLDPSTGVLTFKSAPNFESPGDDVYDVVVTVADGGDPSLTDTQAIAVTVENALFSKLGIFGIANNSSKSYTIEDVPNFVSGTHLESVTIIGLTHNNPDDLDVSLVGPGGQRLYLFSDAGGTGDIALQTYTFRDTATSILQDDKSNAGGTYQTKNFDGGDTDSGLGTITTLAGFDSSSHAGSWVLTIRDDSNAANGFFAGYGGWTLNFEP